MKKLVHSVFKIEGMHCSSCAMNIDFDLEDLDGVEKSQTSYAKQETAVEYDSSVVTLPKLIGQIQKTGYSAKEK